jgi:hypothetical protein
MDKDVRVALKEGESMVVRRKNGICFRWVANPFSKAGNKRPNT